ncbi:hypothetical protein LZC95_32070 [Pendulispora brunnea]|uniref:Uncharacterized protein n=1 Tax=Pendulispora brunnea TaxID=2905690 RepID=A0ABZ2JX47_9BACT
MEPKNRAAFSQRYSATDGIIFVSYPPGFHLATRREIATMFDQVVEFWQSKCRGRKVYYVVDYTNYTTNLAENDFYVTQVKRVIDQCAITIVRFGGDPLTRTGSRLRGMKLHVPTNLYSTKDEALAIVHALREGRLTVGQNT